MKLLRAQFSWIWCKCHWRYFVHLSSQRYLNLIEYKEAVVKNALLVRYIKIRVRRRGLGEIKQKKSSRGSPMNNSLVLLYPIRHSAKPEFWYVEIGLFDTSCGTDKRIQLSNSKFINVTLGVRLASNLGNSLWDSNLVFIISFNFCVPSSNSASFSRIACSFPCPPYTMLNLWKPSEYKLPTLFEGWSEGLGMCELKKVPQIQICPKIFFFRIVVWL